MQQKRSQQGKAPAALVHRGDTEPDLLLGDLLQLPYNLGDPSTAAGCTFALAVLTGRCKGSHKHVDICKALFEGDLSLLVLCMIAGIPAACNSRSHTASCLVCLHAASVVAKALMIKLHRHGLLTTILLYTAHSMQRST
jgi:hypothetical protein